MISQPEAGSSAELPIDVSRRGVYLSAGRNGKTDLVEAHKWFNIAAAGGDRAAAQRRDELAQEIPRDEIVAALRAARLWVTQH